MNLSLSLYLKNVLSQKTNNFLSLLSTKQIAPHTRLGLWQISEEESFFLTQMTLTDAEQQRLAKIKGRRRLEWLAGRWLVHCLSGAKERLLCQADEFGKPHLVHSPYEISLSHSGEYAAAIIGRQSVGIDIQKLVAKIEKIAHKYMRPAESESLDKHRIEHLHIYWGAKEALYKAYGRRRLDFIKHIHIEPFDYQENGTCAGLIKKDDFEATYDIRFERIADYVLVYAIEN